MSRYAPTQQEQIAIGMLRAHGWHIERQATHGNRLQRIAVLEHELAWTRDEKDHHEKWLAGILDESHRLQQRFNKVTAALAASGVEWSTITTLIGDPTAPSLSDAAPEGDS